ncbi:MAG: YhcN/YlaJ family sporulation lipoprotein [Alicyclobacillaceae bacterium]|nr:YhcN/YlaJ family sporulation lipoprotein [Alicyclobacillaceae bacterium]
MRTSIWVAVPAAVLVASLGACGSPLNRPAIVNQTGGAAVEAQYDTHRVDVDGDGDRARLSGRNHVNNPPWDLRSQPPAHSAGTALTHGRYAGNGYADTIARLALSVPGVVSSVAVTSGRVVIVGVGIRHADAHNFRAIQREIRRRVLVNAPDLRYVYVTADHMQVTELNRIADGLRAGIPLDHYKPRIRNLMRTMAPVPLY